jgi:hypothetical protein
VIEKEPLSSVEQVSQTRDRQSFGILSVENLKSYSKSILYSIASGDHDPNENRLLRDIYWRTIEVLATLDNKPHSASRKIRDLIFGRSSEEHD